MGPYKLRNRLFRQVLLRHWRLFWPGFQRNHPLNFFLLTELTIFDIFLLKTVLNNKHRIKIQPQLQCNNVGGVPPKTLAEFTLQGDQGKDFYDISNVDGFNVPLSITPQGVSGCSSVACAANINSLCPQELQDVVNGAVVACKSACLAFNQDQYCCRGTYNDPKICKPTNYSKIFKDACPQAYSYAYDDSSSTFTCVGANYLITFCP
jgi:Thaumatin family